MKTALIAGATGLVGQELLQLLLADADYKKVIALVRKPLSFNHPKLKQEVINFDNLADNKSIFSGVDDVFCCLGTTMKTAGSKEAFRKVDFVYPTELAKLSAEYDVKQFLCITAMGADSRSSIYYNKIKGEVEEIISSFKIPSITFFRPSLLIGERKEKRRGEKIANAIMKALGFLFIGPFKNYKSIHVKKVAEAMLNTSKKDLRVVNIIFSGEMQ